MRLQTLNIIKAMIAGAAILSAYLYVDNGGSSIVVNNKMDKVGTIEIIPIEKENITLDSQDTLEQLPASLQGIDTKIQLSVDSLGALVVNQALRDMFEVYLSALGEEDLETILVRIQKNLNEQLNGQALDQALALLENYVDYRKELVEIQAYINEKSDLISQTDLFQIRQEKIKTLRDKYFDDTTYQAFFSQEDQYDHFLFSQLSINQNSDLSSQEKQLQLASLEAGLPNEVIQVRKSATQYGEVHYEVAELQKNGASSEQVYQARSQQLGDEAASALAELDEKRNAWNIQVDEFKKYKKMIRGSTLSPVDQQLSLQAWLDERFTVLEQLRVKAITASI